MKPRSLPRTLTATGNPISAYQQQQQQVPGFDPSGFVTEQVFYASKDGTRVPMFVVSKKGLPRDGSGAVWLYGYGGFNISVQPSFSSFRVVLMQNLGVTLAIPNIRGGGEYGEEWHKAGILEKKQNVFDDFIAAAEWLVEHKYTSPARLAIAGGSNGGLLVGACLNQRPELFGCAVSMVGVLDMLRYHKFTVGHAWVPEYGCADNPSHFAFLRAYSPLHNIRSGVPYPAVLLTTGDHDDRGKLPPPPFGRQFQALTCHHQWCRCTLTSSLPRSSTSWALVNNSNSH